MQAQFATPIDFLQYENSDNTIGIRLEQTLSRMEEAYCDQVNVLENNINKLHRLLTKKRKPKKTISQVN